jgi:acetylornithine deacetylase/succinyl-diaminopimelate desuccinylase-like protein
MPRFAFFASTTVPAIAAASLLMTAPAQAREPATPHESEALEIYRTIVSYPTYEGTGKVPEMARYLADKFREAGFPEADIHLVPVAQTAALIVRYRGDGSGGKPILLMAHMDVVPARREDWERDPFTLIEDDGFFFGRGSSDDKAGVVSLTATFLRLKHEKFVPRRDLIIFFSGDEETRAKSVTAVIQDHRELIDAEFALNADAGGGVLDEANGKPVLFLVQGAEKTYVDFELSVHNPGGHSSRPRVDNAVYELADALKKVQAYRFPVMSNDWTIGNLAAVGKTMPGPVGEALRMFSANPVDGAAAGILAGEPEYVGLTRTTCVATMLKGGHAPNALPQSATANVNCRIFPGTSIDSVRASLQEVVGSDVSIAVIDDPSSSDASPMRKDVMDSITRVVHKRYPGLPLVPYMSAGASDGKFFRAAGIPVYGVIFIFGKESEQFAHGLNERIRVDQFYNSLEDWHALLEAVAGKAKSR